MRSIEALKEKARHHEQKEQWEPARDLYIQAIAAMDDEAHLDIGLYNRVGDILVKIGDYEGAVEHYQRATDLYLEAELQNNAIAVCKKVARHLPGRNEVYLRMGQIRASQGFLVDARENFLIYAANVEQAGDTEEALRALIEFAALAPEDTEIRLAVAMQLEKHDRKDEAIEQLVAGYRVLRQRGDEDEAATFAERIRALDPDSDPDVLADGLDEGGFDSTSLADDHGGADSFVASFGDIDLPDASTGAQSGPPGDDAATDAVEPVVVEADFGDIVVAGGLDEATSPPDNDPSSETLSPDSSGADTRDADEDDLDFDIGGDLPLVPFDGVEGEGVAEVTGEASSDLPMETSEPAGADELEFAGNLELPDLDDSALDDDREDEEAVPLPFLDLDDEGTADRDEATEEPFGGAPGSSDSGADEAPVGDWEALRDAYDPGRPDADQAQSLVEAAFQHGDSGVLVEAYELLAQALEADGDSARADEVREQIRALDPSHPGPAESLEAEPQADAPHGDERDSGPAPEDPKEEASYVDLGSLVFGQDERTEKTTRFQVAYQEPSGDEAADFANMLAQFKAKVAENFDASDVRAHHDLGTAYKEMGLLDEAVAEFQQALRASTNHLPTYELLGQTFMERGEHAAAVRVLERALKVPSEVEDELIGIYYYLGRAHQELGQVDEAVALFDRVFALDINFADVTARLRELR